MTQFVIHLGHDLVKDVSFLGLEFIYGPASCEHERALVEQAAAWLAKDKKNQVYYLVPNHVKFETEVSVLENLKELPLYQEWETMTTMRLQVFSFTRLAWYYLQHTALYQANHLSTAGTHMLIRKVLLEQEGNLRLFRGEVTKAGFIQQLAELFSELQAGNIAASDLSELVGAMGSSLKENDIKDKLSEFELLYDAYLLALANREIGSSQLISHLAAYLASQDLSKVMFIVTGFSRFNSREQELMAALITHAKEVKVNLVLDRPYVNQLPEAFDMFYDAGKVYHTLYQLARANQVKLYHDTQLLAAGETDLSVLDDFWREAQKLSPKKKVTQLQTDAIQIWEGATPYTEVNQVAKEIRHLVATKAIRYRDIELLTRELDSYEGIIRPVFASHDIPYYLNQSLAMKHHPLVEFLTTLFAIKQRHFRYTDVMRFLRTELFLVIDKETLTLEEWQLARNDYRDKIDVTENVVLAYGYEGFYWTQEKDWRYVYHETEETVGAADSTSANQELVESQELKNQRLSNEIRRDISQQLLPFYQQLSQAKTGKDAASALYQFLISAGVEAELIFWRNQDIANGQLEAAKIHEQTWQAFIGLLDEYVDILGESAFVLEEFITILQTGLEGLTYSKVPTTIDQVTVSSLDLIHAQKNKVTFIIGATEGSLPQKIENKSLLSDDERLLINQQLTPEKFLMKNTAADLVKEPYIAYLAFQSASERLYLTYPATNDNSKEVKISPYLKSISQELGVKVQSKTDLPSDYKLTLGQISTYRSLITDLNALKRVATEEGATISPEWLALEQELLGNVEYQGLAHKIFTSQQHKNIPETLTPTTVSALYGEKIYGSVSKIETFHQCQYRYFMNYGLELKERAVFELSPAATGDFYHEALDQLFKVLIREQLVLSELTPKALGELTEQVLLNLLGEHKFSILNTTHRMNYIRYQLSQTIQRVSWALQKQSQRSGLSTIQTEVLFGQIAQQSGLDSLKIDLGKQKELHIRGKIDRLDRLDVNNETYLAVVDYKSSRHTFDYRDAYFGLAMQMITYLDVALSNTVKLLNQKEVKPAGAFYLQIKNPTIDGSIPPEAATEQLFKEFGYQGLLLEDNVLLERIDHSLNDQSSSSIYPYRVKKNGDYSSSQFVSETELDLLIKRNQANFKQAGQEIYQGQTKLNPAYRDKQRIACQYCPFRSVCQFDVMLKENEYHRLEKLSKQAVMAKLTEEEGGNLND